ncbi:MAG: hypothetical protein QNJ51_30290, partial [Calothrix sp. MO_167.B12]|nr:hypothetical protein [Calothrix sp. MO_167.B12]
DPNIEVKCGVDFLTAFLPLCDAAKIFELSNKTYFTFIQQTLHKLEKSKSFSNKGFPFEPAYFTDATNL